MKKIRAMIAILAINLTFLSPASADRCSGCGGYDLAAVNGPNASPVSAQEISQIRQLIQSGMNDDQILSIMDDLATQSALPTTND